MASFFPHYLFGHYVIQIAKLFKYSFSDFQQTDTAVVRPLQVFYGTPREAFKSALEKNNGQMVLPSLSFYGADYTRRWDKEPANPNLRISNANSYDPITGKIIGIRPPMQFDVSYQFSMFNNNMRERDKMLHQMFMMFPKGEASIRWYPDPIQYDTSFLFMPLKWDQQVTDATEIEGLTSKETRDIIKTTFNIKSEAVLPYDIKDEDAYYVAKGIIIQDYYNDTETGIKHLNNWIVNIGVSDTFEAGTFGLRVLLSNPTINP